MLYGSYVYNVGEIMSEKVKNEKRGFKTILVDILIFLILILTGIYLYAKYVELASKNKNLYLGGRLGLYKYLDMDDTIIEAFKLLDQLGIKR